MSNQNQDQETPYQYYKETRGYAVDFKLKEWTRFENILFVLTTGAFVLSINLLTGGHKQLAQPRLMVVSWISLFLSLVSHSVSFFLAKRSSEKLIDALDKWKDKNFKPEIFSFKTAVGNTDKWVEYLNYSTFFLMLLGLLFLTIFASINL